MRKVTSAASCVGTNGFVKFLTSGPMVVLMVLVVIALIINALTGNHSKALMRFGLLLVGVFVFCLVITGGWTQVGKNMMGMANIKPDAAVAVDLSKIQQCGAAEPAPAAK